MRGLSGLVWSLLVVAMLVGVAATVGSRLLGQPEALDGVVASARTLDRAASGRLEDLALRFAPKPGSGVEPSVNLEEPSEADFRFLFSVLASNDARARVSAAKVLREIGDPRAVRPLIDGIRGLESIDVFLLECALTITDRQPPDARISALVPVWEEERRELGDEMRQAVRLKLRDAGALDPAFLEDAAVSHGDPVVRRFAVRELGELPRPPGGVLAAAMADPDERVRALAQETFLAAAAKRGGR